MPENDIKKFEVKDVLHWSNSPSQQRDSLGKPSPEHWQFQSNIRNGEVLTATKKKAKHEAEILSEKHKRITFPLPLTFFPGKQTENPEWPTKTPLEI